MNVCDLQAMAARLDEYPSYIGLAGLPMSQTAWAVLTGSEEGAT